MSCLDDCNTCAPRLCGQSCGQALADGWLVRHWTVLQRIIYNTIPHDISVANITELNLELDGAHTDLIQTLEYEQEQHPDTNSWLTQNGPLICQALQENMNTRLELAQITEAYQTATEEMHAAFELLQQHLFGSQSAHEEADNHLSAPGQTEHHSNEVIIVYDSDDDDGTGVASMVARHCKRLAGSDWLDFEN